MTTHNNTTPTIYNVLAVEEQLPPPDTAILYPDFNIRFIFQQNTEWAEDMDVEVQVDSRSGWVSVGKTSLAKDNTIIAAFSACLRNFDGSNDPKVLRFVSSVTRANRLPRMAPRVIKPKVIAVGLENQEFLDIDLPWVCARDLREWIQDNRRSILTQVLESLGITETYRIYDLDIVVEDTGDNCRQDYKYWKFNAYTMDGVDDIVMTDVSAQPTERNVTKWLHISLHEVSSSITRLYIKRESNIDELLARIMENDDLSDGEFNLTAKTTQYMKPWIDVVKNQTLVYKKQ